MNFSQRKNRSQSERKNAAVSINFVTKAKYLSSTACGCVYSSVETDAQHLKITVRAKEEEEEEEKSLPSPTHPPLFFAVAHLCVTGSPFSVLIRAAAAAGPAAASSKRSSDAPPLPSLHSYTHTHTHIEREEEEEDCSALLFFIRRRASLCVTGSFLSPKKKERKSIY